MGNIYENISLFDEDEEEIRKKFNVDNYKLPRVTVALSDNDLIRLKKYNLDDYVSDVEKIGLSKTWEFICEYSKKHYGENDFLRIDKFGELYEIGLATQDKQLKKDSGQYYTPEDVAEVMSKWFDSCEGYNICDVACGTGKLILTYLDLIGKEKAISLIKEGRLYLYDFDQVALRICKTAISLKYGLDLEEQIHDVYCDFLDKNVFLPENCKVISNPPYAGISNFGENWKITNVLEKAKDFYPAFMEKVFLQAKSAVIITPFSFISGSKFFPLRKLMCEEGSGFIVSFDNVPGNIFCGRKHGIFNTNTANSVRAAITVFKQVNNNHGFQTTHLIRFKNSERSKVLVNSYLENLLSPDYQIVTDSNPMFKKVDRRLNDIYKTWVNNSNSKLESLVSKNGEYTIAMPNTCRYFTTASNVVMKRNGQVELNFSDEDKFNYVFCLINSSFAYWHWRIYDGGITYPKSLLLEMPVFFDKLNDKDKQFFKDVANEMISKMSDFTITKNNVGVQENIKFPREYRDRINERLLKILNVKADVKIFDYIHSNMSTEVSV